MTGINPITGTVSNSDGSKLVGPAIIPNDYVPANLSSDITKKFVPNTQSYFSSSSTGGGLPNNFYTDNTQPTTTPDNTMLYIGLGVLVLIIVLKS